MDRVAGNKTGYLTHLDGLRALAIIMVLLYHSKTSWLRSGYFGVDVFFVLSGFLMFRGCLQKLREDHFSLKEYYTRKLYRIYPPLVVLVFLTVPLSIALCLAPQPLYAAEQGLAALVGISNYFLDNFFDGYFDNDAKSNLLMHTWFVAVTLQAYLLLPLLMWVLRRLPLWIRMAFWCLFGLLLLLVCYHYSPAMESYWGISYPGWVQWLSHAVSRVFGDALFLADSSTYLWTTARLWELLCGGAVLLLPVSSRKWVNTLLFVVGVCLVIIPATQAMGFVNIPVVVGAMLVIQYGDCQYLSCLLTNRVMRAVGAVSFSLFLCHWPICVIWKSYLAQRPSALDGIGMIVLSLAVSALFYLWVEKRRFSGKVLCSLFVVAFGLCALTVYEDGFRAQVHRAANAIEARTGHDAEPCTRESLLRDYPADVVTVETHFQQAESRRLFATADQGEDMAPLLVIGDPTSEPNFVLLGDSHANALYPAFDRIGRQEGWAGVFPRAYTIPFWAGHEQIVDFGPHTCVNQQRSEALIAWLGRHPEIKTVLIAQYWVSRIRQIRHSGGRRETDYAHIGEWQQALREFCQALKAQGKNIYLIEPAPSLDINPVVCRRRAALLGSTEDPTVYQLMRDVYEMRNKPVVTVLRELEKEGVADFLPLCEPLFDERGVFDACRGGDLLLSDEHHLSVPGAESAVRGSLSRLKKILK